MELYDKFFKCSGCERKCVVAIGKCEKDYTLDKCFYDKEPKWRVVEKNKCEVKE